MILKIKCLLICLGLSLISNNVSATEQMMDALIYNDSVSYIFSENLISGYRPIRELPLENYLWKQYADSTKREVIDEMLKSYRWCLRGYIATWEIRSDSLFLIRISYYPTMVTAYIEGKPSDSFPLQKLFPDQNVTNGVFADWFSGRIFTVAYHRTYPPLNDEDWANKRKTFVIMDGKILGVRRW